MKNIENIIAEHPQAVSLVSGFIAGAVILNNLYEVDCHIIGGCTANKLLLMRFLFGVFGSSVTEASRCLSGYILENFGLFQDRQNNRADISLRAIEQLKQSVRENQLAIIQEEICSKQYINKL